MGTIRIRWRGVARAAAIVVVALIALRVVPGLLRAPEPPPLGREVGLPKARRAPIEPAREVTKRPAQRHKAAGTRRRPRSRRKVRARTVPDAPASTAVIGSRRGHRSGSPRNQRHHHDAGNPISSSPDATTAETASPPPAVPEHVAPPPSEAPPPIAPEPTPTPPPEPTPAPPKTPGDGSQEFAPH